MTIEVLRERISSFFGLPNLTAEVYLLMKDGGLGGIKRADIDDDLNAEIVENYRREVVGKIVEDEGVSLLNLSAADDRRNAIFKYDFDDDDAGRVEEIAVLEEIPDLEGIPYFEDGDDLSSLKAFLVLIADHERSMVLYSPHYPVGLVKRGHFLSAILGDDRIFRKLSSDVIRIGGAADIISLDGDTYVLNMKTLERSMGFHELIKGEARKSIEEIRASDILVSTEMLEASVGDMALARKLAAISQGSPVLGHVPNDHIIGFAKANPALAGKFKFSEDGTKIDIKTKKAQRLFLKLLNDDYLTSELTHNFYETHAKDSIDVVAAVD